MPLWHGGVVRYGGSISVRGRPTLNPLSISGLQFWIDSNDPTTFTYSSGVVVSQWNDKSGNARHVSHGTVARQPSRNGTRNGKSTVVFTAASTHALRSANITLAQPVTVFTVAQAATVDAGNHQILGNGTESPTVFYNGGFFSYYAGSTVASATAEDTSWHYLTGVFNGASSSLRRDGTEISTGNPGAGGWDTEPICIGNDFADATPAEWDGPIAEVLIYNSVLSATDRNRVEAYLASKWGF